MFTLAESQIPASFLSQVRILRAIPKLTLLNAQKSYQNNIDSVTEYCKKGSSIVLGSLITEPKWFDTNFINTFQQSKTHMQYWYTGMDSILSQLNSIPYYIVQYDEKYKQHSKKIIHNCGLVINTKDPDIRREYIDSIAESLDYLANSVEDYTGQTQICYDNLTGFKNTFGKYKTFFQSTLQNASKSTQEDQDKINKLQAEVDDLTKRVDEYNKKVRDLSIATGVLAGVGILTIFTPALIFVPFLFIGAIGTGIADIVAACELKRYKISLAIKQESLTNYGMDLQVLTSMTKSFTDLNNLIEAAAISIEDVHSRWNDLYHRLKIVVDRLKTDRERVEDELFSEIIESMKLTDNEWNIAVTYAEQLNLAAMDLSDTGVHEF